MSFLKAAEAALRPPPDPTQPRGPAPTTPGDANRWAGRALAAETDAVAAATEGTRNDTLNTAAYNLGQIVAGGNLDELTVVQALTGAARVAGLPPREIDQTIRSGMKAGYEHPRTGPTTPLQPLPELAPFDTTTSDQHDLAAAVREHLPILDWDELWADTSEEEWILEPLLPARRLVALYSAPKVGKSLLMLELAVAVSRGTSALGVTPDRARRVLYVDFENDPKGDIRERLQDMGLKPDDLRGLAYLSFPTLAALDSDRGGRELLAAITTYACEVVVIDTVSRAVTGDENENDTWLNFYRHTGLRLKQAGVALIRLDHTGKDETKGQRGGSAKSGDVDAVWRMSRVTDDTYQLTCEAARLPIAEKTLVLHRQAGPLHHRVDAEGRAAAWRAKLTATIAAMDAAGLPDDTGASTARDTVRASGIRARNDLIAAAVKERKQRLEAVPDTWGQVIEKELSPNGGDSAGTVRTP